MTNIIGRSDTETTIFERFMGALKDVRYLMAFSSPVMSQYFQSVTECMIKRKVRHFMKLLVSYWCVMILKSLRQTDASMTDLKFSSLMMGSFILFYIYMFQRLSRSEYRFISLILTIGSLNYTLYESCRKDAAMDDSYAYPFSLIVMIIIFLPLDMTVIIPGVLVFCVTFVVISSRQVTYAQLQRDLYKSSFHPLYSQTNIYRYYIVEAGTEAWSVLPGTYYALQVVNWFTVIFIGSYLRFWNDLRRKSAFSIIGESVRARAEIEKFLADQRDWITAIMPIQVRDQYISMLRDKTNEDNNIWVFSKSFNEVSILFADIVGFTKMSSSKTATKIVMLLNDLYNRFDDLSIQVNCEKIGTLGDCYYAVAGCPVERKDHAMCCVEFGLGMCRIIKIFNKDNNEDVNMRVGVHTGRVNAAIIGCSRFRYDVYSTDVIVANEMETYGLPGRVHISHTTFKLVKGLYRFARGPPLPMIKEQQIGIAGLNQVEVELKTYFVDPLSSLMRNENENYGQEGVPTRILTLQNEVVKEGMKKSVEGSPGNRNTSDEDDKHIRDYTEGYITPSDDQITGPLESEQIRRNNLRDIRLVQKLRDDPKCQIKLFRFTPLTPVLHRFQDKVVESAFKNYMEGSIPVVTIESPRLAPILDALMITLLTTIFLVPHAIQVNINSNRNFFGENLVYVVVMTFSFIITSIFVYGSAKHTSSVNTQHRTRLRIFTSYAFREIILAILTLMPTLVFFAHILFAESGTSDSIQVRVIYVEFGMLTILIHCMASSSSSWTRGLCITTSAVCFCYNLGKMWKDFDYTYCEPTLWYLELDKPVESINEHIASLLTLTAVVYFIATENERSIRLWYYVLREAESARGIAVKEREMAQQLLNNVIPPYIFTQLAMRGHRHLKAGKFCFATAVSDVAVTFATLTNFFKSYYREDYRGGENALKLLNTIICAFDNLMKQPKYASVEKIKTVNDCYMIAAGLNQLQRESQLPKDKHVYELMDFNFALYDTLAEINDKYIIGTDKFQMKIGYYVGDVTAGIIGSRKPIYDIWGNTVNVASRMYSTGSAGQIQIPKEVTERLGDRYHYEYRGKVFVKGKGEMLVYFVHKKKVDAVE